jgi:hypothetical protein
MSFLFDGLDIQDFSKFHKLKAYSPARVFYWLCLKLF